MKRVYACLVASGLLIAAFGADGSAPANAVWGAIATHETDGFGVGYLETNQSDAEKSAIAVCERSGNISCKIAVSYGNSCGSLVSSESDFSTGTGLTKAQAEQAGMKACKDAGYDGCKVAYSGCAPEQPTSSNQAVPTSTIASPASPRAVWGAMATRDTVDPDVYVVGFANSASSRQAAEKKALADCKAMGGGDCKIDISYSNGCAALERSDDGGYGASTGITEAQASDAATKACGAAGHKRGRGVYAQCTESN